MNFKSCFLLLIAALVYFHANSAVWRVNNRTGVDADFTNINDANAAASPGDVIYVEASLTPYPSAAITKQLTLVGPGYFLTVNPTTQAYPVSATLTSITFSLGSDNSVINGFTINTIYLYSNNVMVKRNYITTGGFTPVQLVADGISGTIIEENYIHQLSASVNGNYRAIQLANNADNTVIRNNIIRKYDNTVDRWLIYGPTSATNTLLVNNVMFGKFELYNATITNNILGVGTYTNDPLYPSSVFNNIANATQFGNTNGNQENVLMSTVLEMSGSIDNDAYYQLASGSPAIGAGLAGEDCGAFGGLYPYKLSGLPDIPAIYEATVPAVGNTTTGMNVNIKSKSHE